MYRSIRIEALPFIKAPRPLFTQRPASGKSGFGVLISHINCRATLQWVWPRQKSPSEFWKVLLTSARYLTELLLATCFPSQHIFTINIKQDRILTG